jgi:DNA-binding transcriptional ArsR family regulator
MYMQLAPAVLEHVAERFRVLGDPNRLRIIQTLMAAGELNVGELVDRLEMSQANVSKHLRLLLEADVVMRRPEGTAAYYSVSDPSVERLCELVCDRILDQKSREAAALGLN